MKYRYYGNLKIHMKMNITMLNFEKLIKMVIQFNMMIIIQLIHILLMCLTKSHRSQARATI